MNMPTRSTPLLLCVLALAPFLSAAKQPPSTPLLAPGQVEPMIREAERFLGATYVFGASPDRDDIADCSSLVMKAFKGLGVAIPRRAYEQSLRGVTVPRDELRRGDRLYYKMTDRPIAIDHTAIYLGDGKILHAWPGRGVVVVEADWLWDFFRYAKR